MRDHRWFVLVQYKFKWVIFSFRYLSSDTARYSADFDANHMSARYFIRNISVLYLLNFFTLYFQDVLSTPG